MDCGTKECEKELGKTREEIIEDCTKELLEGKY